MSRRTQWVGACVSALVHVGCGGEGGGERPSGATGTPSASAPGSGGSGADMPRPPLIDPEALPDGMTLRAAADASGRRIGIALTTRRLGEALYAATARQEFNYVTAENEMKWDQIQQAPGVFDFSRADRIVEFAEQNAMAVKGHTLVWHSQLPDWVEALATPDEVRATMLTHIDTVVSHYRGRVVAWDVVNEAWQDGGSGLRSSVFFTQLGAGFIDEAFRAARAADPDAKLYYNDYGGEGTSGKANAIFGMAQGMLARGVPIDGVGMQMHTRATGNASPSIADFNTNMQRLRDLGLEVVISELDVSSCSAESMDTRMNAQGTRYYEIARACVNEAACSAITIWGMIDRYSWLNDQAQNQGTGCSADQEPLPLLFDDRYQKKPAYAGMLNALLGME